MPFKVEADCTSKRMISTGDAFGKVSKQLKLETLCFLVIVYSFVLSTGRVDKPSWSSKVLGDLEDPESS